MNDLIKRQDAINATWEEPTYSDPLNILTEVRDKLKNLPSVQPEIIRCKECVHWKHSTVRKNYCDVFDWVNKEDDYCSFAERRENVD